MSVFVCWSRGGNLGGLVGGDLDGEAPVLDVVDDVASSVAAGVLVPLLSLDWRLSGGREPFRGITNKTASQEENSEIC